MAPFTFYPLRLYANTSFAKNLFLASIEWRIPLNILEYTLRSPPIGVLQNGYNLLIDSGSLFDDNHVFKLKTGVGAELISELALF